MTLLRRRIVGAAAVLATLAISACAVPGQGDPGVAATYGDRVVTNQQVLDMSQGYADLGTASSGAGAPLTMLLIGPDLIAGAEKLGMVVSDDKLNSVAEEWIAFNRRGGTVTPAALELVRDLLAVLYLSRSADGIAVLEQAGIDAEAGVVASPRYGSFTRTQYVTTVNGGFSDVDKGKEAMGDLLFVPLKEISGFAGASPTWISGG
jgi:hypothetical protein